MTKLRTWKEILEWAGVDPNYTPPPKKKMKKKNPTSHTREVGEYHSDEQPHVVAATEEFMREYRERVAPPTEEELNPKRKAKRKAPFRVERRSVKGRLLKVGASIEVPENLDYTKFKRGTETNRVTRVVSPPVATDDTAILETAMGPYIIPREHKVTRVLPYENLGE